MNREATAPDKKGDEDGQSHKLDIILQVVQRRFVRGCSLATKQPCLPPSRASAASNGGLELGLRRVVSILQRER